jgi:hypothetical protein
VAQFWGAPFAVISGGIGCVIGTLLIIWKWPQLLKFNCDEPVESGIAPSPGASIMVNRARRP